MIHFYLFATVVGGLLVGASLLRFRLLSEPIAPKPQVPRRLALHLCPYLLAFGAPMGLMLRLVGRVREPVALLTALGVGLFAAAIMDDLTRRAKL